GRLAWRSGARPAPAARHRLGRFPPHRRRLPPPLLGLPRGRRPRLARNSTAATPGAPARRRGRGRDLVRPPPGHRPPALPDGGRRGLGVPLAARCRLAGTGGRAHACERSQGRARRSPRLRGLRGEKSGGDLLSRGASPQVPSALAGLTSVFGMGTGVTPPLWPPENLFSIEVFPRDFHSEHERVCSQALGRLVPVG